MKTLNVNDQFDLKKAFDANRFWHPSSIAELLQVLEQKNWFLLLGIKKGEMTTQNREVEIEEGEFITEPYHGVKLSLNNFTAIYVDSVYIQLNWSDTFIVYGIKQGKIIARYDQIYIDSLIHIMEEIIFNPKGK